MVVKSSLQPTLVKPFRKKKENPSEVTKGKSPNVLHYVEVITEENQTQSTGTGSNGDNNEEVITKENETSSSSSGHKEVVEGLKVNVEDNDEIYTVNACTNAKSINISDGNGYEEVITKENETSSSSSRDKEVVEGFEVNVEVNDGIYTVNTGTNAKSINISHDNSFEEVITKENKTSSSSSREKEVVEGLEVNVDVNDGIYILNKVNTLSSNQIHPNEQAVRDDYSFDNEWNGDTSTKHTAVMDNEGANDEGSKSDDELRSVSNDIYTCQHEVGINIRKNVVPKSGRVTMVDNDATIYCMSPVRTTTKDNEKPISEETGDDSGGNKDDTINYGIYTM